MAVVQTCGICLLAKLSDGLEQHSFVHQHRIKLHKMEFEKVLNGIENIYCFLLRPSVLEA